MYDDREYRMEDKEIKIICYAKADAVLIFGDERNLQ